MDKSLYPIMFSGISKPAGSEIAFLPAKPEEATILSELRRRAWATTYRGIFPDDMIDHFDYALHNRRDLQRIQSAQYLVFFIVKGHEKIGYLILQKAAPFRLQSLYLLREHRGQGIGTITFAFVRAFCREHGISKFVLDCHPDNLAALAFYDRMGGTVTQRDVGHERNEENGITIEFMCNER